MSITGDQIRAARKELGLTTPQLAQMCSLTTWIISDFESGRSTGGVEIIKNLRRTLEEEGIEFIDDEPGVRMRGNAFQRRSEENGTID